MELKKAIIKRKSVRDFSDKIVPKEVMDELIKYAMMIPSAGDLRPLTLEAQHNCLIIYADFSKTMVKYGTRGIQYVFQESGHMAQNILLIATEMGLCSYPVGAFQESQLTKLNLTPIYIIMVGYPKEKK